MSREGAFLFVFQVYSGPVPWIIEPDITLEGQIQGGKKTFLSEAEKCEILSQKFPPKRFFHVA